MEAPVLYLMNVSICLGIVYIFYIAIFRTMTFFMTNRFYLMSGLVLSFAVPALDITIASEGYEALATHPVANSFKSQVNAFIPPDTIISTAESLSFTPVLSILYYVGVVISLIRVVYAVRRIVQLRKRSTKEDVRGSIKVFRTDLRHPFSILNWIFLPEGDTNPLIVEHEKVHVRQYHWIDLIILEAASVLLWFNPLMIFYKRSLKSQHEYLADAYAVRDRISVGSYLMLLWNQIQIDNSPGPISHFYSNTIKNRIIMITRKRTPLMYYAVYLLGIPVSCAMLFAFSNKAPEVSTQSSVKSAMTIIVDPGHGGSDAGSTSVSAVEKDLTLAIARKVKIAGSKRGVNVILTRAGDQTLSLSQRATMADKTSASLFVSLHLNTHADASKSGIECFISEENAAYEQSRRFSDQVLRELGQLKGISVNGVMTTDFYILKNNKLPAIALELGYLSNAADRAFITRDGNQTILAEQIISAALKHLK